MNNIIVKIYICLAIVTVIVCCTKYEQKEIAFSPLAQKTTKTIMTSTTYTDGGFVVTAYRNGTQLYFQDVAVKTHDASTNLWSGDVTCYWPMGGSLNFTAYSPYTLKTKGATATQNAVNCSGYSISDTSDMGVDFCYASAERSDCAADKSVVDLVFHHALSYINVNIGITGTYDNGSASGLQNSVSITINKVELQNIKSTGDFSYMTNSASDVHWSSQANPVSYNITAPNGESSVGFLMIPQTLSADAAIKVEYTIIQKVTNNGSEVRTITTKHEGTAVIGDTTPSWEENKKITYDLNINPLQPITFSAVYSQEWDIQPDYTYQF